VNSTLISFPTTIFTSTYQTILIKNLRSLIVSSSLFFVILCVFRHYL
jgi:hypothetical protein